ncbi:hypothetical protein DEO72_LG11g2568 [Vigna unguiculata]|uniref:Uncharacterized protein n=1 Tax=Vigna unguiculata TaxID=3917 RepID=A0A4D6NUU2_VIGUN|nr:hypothetical protein DEO72_LG11g2568 [Vigna unguiculata]
MPPAQMAKLLNHRSLADHENLAHLLPSTKLMIIAKKNNRIQHSHATKRESVRSSPKEIVNKMPPAQMAKLLNHRFLADHENLAHLLPSTKLMIIARKNNHIQHSHATKRARAQKQVQEQCGISLKRDPSRLGELPARSKVKRVAWATFRAKT